MRYLLGLVALGLVVASPATASVFWTETFESYTQGNLVPQGGWAAHSATTANYIQVILDNGPTFPGVQAASGAHASGSRQDVNKSIGTPMVAGQKFYAGFDVKIATLTGAADYLAHFRGAGTSTAFVDKFGTQIDGTGFNFTLTAGSGATPTAVFPGTMTLGNWYRIVFAYTFDSSLNEVWVNPVTEASANITGVYNGSTTTPTPAQGLAVENFCVRQGSAGTAGFVVDNIVTGTTFAEVLPEPATLALMVVGGLMLTRRR
jgi:hypothetical protein